MVSAFTNNQFDFAGARPVSAGFNRPPQGTILGASIDTGDGNMRIPYTHQWNAAIQQELPGSVSVTVAYVGTAGIKQQAVGNINQPVPGTTPIVQRRPFPLFNTIRTIQDRYNSSYNALQGTVERRFGRGLGFQLAYTYSHSIDDLTGADQLADGHSQHRAGTRKCQHEPAPAPGGKLDL